MSARFPKCKPKHCRKLPNIENGAVIHNGTYRGAIVNYRCDRGFRLTGTNSRVCRRNKNWSRSPPVCTPIKCVKPHNIAHGEVDYNPDDLQFGSKVKFYCHLGYELTGMNERVCGEDGSWIGEEPECVLIRCPPPKIPLHGEQEIHDLSVGGSISYNCNHGYKLVGPRVLTCLNNKTWTGKNPMCKKIICELPKNITNGYVKYSDMHYQASVDYTCEDGYNLVGLRTRSCLHSGRWNGKEPQCVPHFCNPVVVKNGWVNSEGNSPGDKANVGCDPGFQIAGTSLLVCQMNLLWTPSIPSCVSLACGQPPQVSNALAQAEGFSYLDMVTYSCVPGYEIRGSSQIVCGEDGGWKGDLPSCLPKPCGLPRTFPDMKVAFDSKNGYDLGYNSKAIYKCNPGFHTNNTNILTCGQNGEWMGKILPCEKIPCGGPPLLASAEVEVVRNKHQYSATFTCHDGYKLNGSGSIRCKADGNWKLAMGECVPITCGPPPHIENGRLSGTGRTFMQNLTLDCDEGYLPGEADKLRCSSTGAWVGGDLTCKLAHCNSLPSLGHGSVAYTKAPLHAYHPTDYPLGSLARFACDNGYTLFGSDSSTCLANQTWSGDFPHCQRVWCAGVDPPKHGFMMGVGKQWQDVIRFSCESGYRMFGSAEIECLSSGNWSSPPPTCHRVWCDLPSPGSGQQLPASLTGRLTGSVNNGIKQTFPHRHRIKLSCRQGHRQRGDLSITCQPNGRWSRPEGACHRISCGRPEVEAGATLLSQTFVFGSRVPYSCPSGEYPVNSPLHCQADGSWSSNPGRCFRVNK